MFLCSKPCAVELSVEVLLYVVDDLVIPIILYKYCYLSIMKNC